MEPERDDESDPGGRIYRDEQGNVFLAATRFWGKRHLKSSELRLKMAGASKERG